MKAYKILFISCILWFVFLCLLHYFSLRPLWLDEELVFKNLQELSSLKLLGPLGYTQMFPRLYLIIINFFARGFDYNLLALRLPSLLCMFLAFFVWLKVFQQILPGKWQVLLAIFSFASSYRIIYYAAELKPYSMDVLVAGVFCWYLLCQKQLETKAPSKLFITVTFLLPFTLALSYSSFFFFWMVIYNYIFIVKKNHKAALLFALYSFLCLLIIISTYYFYLRYELSGSTVPWNNYFLGTQSFYSFIKPFGEGLRKLTTFWFGNSKFFIKAASFLIPIFVISLFGYGIRSLKKNKCRFLDADSIGLVIFLELVVLGILRKYPFTGARITLFFAPLIFFLIIKGIGSLKRIKPLYIGLNTCYIAFLVMCSLNSFFAYLKLYN
ncbi:MAG: hypothetical protein WC937_00245 [Candidatus Omnitrophota bacterium]|jgi:hypothetical protein|nr:hypothetical protein [Candidatus Omnitrophota bacterium]